MNSIHELSLEVDGAPESAVDAGADLNFRVRVACPAGCDLGGVPVTMTSEGTVVPLRVPDDAYHARSEEDEWEAFVATAPSSVGEHVWTLSVPTQEVVGILHEASSLELTMQIRAHYTSMAVWEIPSPVVMGSDFSMKVGVKCSAECPIGGGRFEVLSETGARIGGGVLGEAPYPGTDALYAAEVDLTAPLAEGVVVWTARFVPDSVSGPHEGSAASFSLPSVRPPEHRVTVSVTEKDTGGAPLGQAAVRLGAYRASTDGKGRAALELPKGSYPLNVWKPGYEPISGTLDVDQDVDVSLEASVATETDTDDEREWM